MGKKDDDKIRWLDEPEEHNYPSAYSYLSLVYDEEDAKRLVKKLRDAPMTTFKSRDIFRASELSLLGISNAKVNATTKRSRTENTSRPSCWFGKATAKK